MNYNNLFNTVYSTNISESTKIAILEKLSINDYINESVSEFQPILEALDILAYSEDITEERANEVIDILFSNMDEALVEQILEDYVRMKAVDYLLEAHGTDAIGLSGISGLGRRVRGADGKVVYDKQGRPKFTTKGNWQEQRAQIEQELEDKRKEQKEARDRARKEAISKTISKAKAGVKNVSDNVKAKATAIKDSAVSKSNEIKDSIANKVDTVKNKIKSSVDNVKAKAVEVGNNIKGAANTAKNIAGYTANKFSGRNIIDKVKGAVGKVKNWWNSYKDDANKWAENKEGTNKVNNLKGSVNSVSKALKNQKSSVGASSNAN